MEEMAQVKYMTAATKWGSTPEISSVALLRLRNQVVIYWMGIKGYVGTVPPFGKRYGVGAPLFGPSEHSHHQKVKTKLETCTIVTFNQALSVLNIV